MKTIGLIGLIGLIALGALAGDINKGYTFSPGEHNVTHTKLNNLVDQAAVNPSFYTDKAATTQPAAADLVLIYNQAAGAFRRTTLNSLLLANTNLIAGQAELTALATNAMVLVLDPTQGYGKAQLGNIFTNWAALMSADQLGALSSPSNNPSFLVWDPTNGWKNVSLTNLPSLITPTNLAPVTSLLSLTNGDSLSVYDPTNKLAKRLPVSVLLSSGSAQTNFTNTAGGILLSNAHGLAAAPSRLRTVLVCVTNELGYVTGQEVDTGIIFTEGPTPGFITVADATNVLVYCSPALASSSNRYYIPELPTGTPGSILDRRRWAVKAYWSQ